jgi:hypothetical protein
MATDAANIKADKPKVFTLLFDYFPRSLVEVARCGELGAEKHGRKSFMNEDYPSEGLMDAAARHMLALAKDGPINQGDGGMYHKAQAAWGLLASLEKDLKEKEDNHDS